MRETTHFSVFLALLAVTKGQVYGGYQYRAPYPPYYRMAPVYRWYDQAKNPAATIVEVEPNTQDVTPFEIQGLLYTNLHRRVHTTPDLQLDHDLSLQAARYAQQISEALLIKHAQAAGRPGQAENIFMRCKAFSKGASAFEAIKSWYSTICHWEFHNPAPTTDKGKPFARLIWKTTQQMGMGRATFQVDNFNCTVVVARYSPHVNALDFSENVPKGNFNPTFCQYINNKEDNDFITPQQPGKACQRIPGFKGQMLVENSACTVKELFSIFGASVRKGKQGFSVVL